MEIPKRNIKSHERPPPQDISSAVQAELGTAMATNGHQGQFTHIHILFVISCRDVFSQVKSHTINSKHEDTTTGNYQHPAISTRIRTGLFARSQPEIVSPHEELTGT